VKESSDTVAIIATDEESLGANGFSRCCGNKEAEEGDFHDCAEECLKNGVLRLKINLCCIMSKRGMAEYCSSNQREGGGKSSLN
jgi:hypothetical protein